MDVEKVYKELIDIKIAQVSMGEDLKNHMRRTELLETAIIPINNVYTIGKWVIAVCVGLLGVFATILKIIEFFKR